MERGICHIAAVNTVALELVNANETSFLEVVYLQVQSYRSRNGGGCCIGAG